ncbi:hypothetical protein LXL04_005545 [Taraxacum kok-saghyz]
MFGLISAKFEESHSECRLFRMKENLSNKISMSALFQKNNSLFHTEHSHWFIISITYPLRHTIRHPKGDGTCIKCAFFAGYIQFILIVQFKRNRRFLSNDEFLSLFIVQSSHSNFQSVLDQIQITNTQSSNLHQAIFKSSYANLQTFIMATQNPAQNPEPSEQYSFPDIASSFPVLEIKKNNLFLNLKTVLQPGARFFDSSFKSIFVCLKHSKISTALTLTCSVPISVLSRAYATTRYDKPTESMHFNLSSDKATSITKQHFYKLLHLPVSTELIHPDSISNVDLINIKLLLTLIYAIYTNANIDIGHILWTQFCLSPNSSTQTTNISMARFWSIVVDGALGKFVELRGDDSTPMAEISELQVNKLQFVKHRVFDHCGEIPNEMWSVVPEDEPQKNKVKKDNKGVLPPLVVRDIPAVVQERIESIATKKPQAKRKRGEAIETEQVQTELEQTTPKKKKSKKVAQKPSKKSKKKPALVDESSDDEATQFDASHHSEAQPDQTEPEQHETPPRKTEAGTSKTPPEQPQKDTTFDDLGNITKLTQTPRVPPHETENPEQTNKTSPTRSESEHVDEEIKMDQPEDELFNPNKATTSSYVPPAEKFTFFPVTFEEEPLTSEQEDLFATKKDIHSLKTLMNAIIVGMDPSKISHQEEMVKKQSEEVKEIRKEILTSIDTLQADFTSKVSDVEKKLDEIAQKAASESEMKAQLHAQEIKLKELVTQLESKTHEADHRQRVIDIYKVQNQEMNLKLVKLVEDKDAQVLKLSEKVDGKFEQMLKAISEISVPKVVEKIVEKVIEKPRDESQEGGDRSSSSKKPKPSEPEPEGRGKAKVTTEPNLKETPDTSKDEELAKKLATEERIKASAIRNEQQIKNSELRIWPVWTRQKIMKAALPEADPYWLHPIASQRVNLDANFQLDMPICPRAFIFKYMEPSPFFNGDNEMMNKILIDFHAKQSKLQQEVWSCIPIKTVQRIRRTDLISNAFYNWEFEITRGTEKTKSTITFADIPLMNPSDWINIHQIFVIKGEDYLKPHIKVFKLLMQHYMFEMGKFDLVAAELTKRIPKTVEPIYCDFGINSDGLITKDPWGIVVKINVNEIIFLQSRNSREDRKEAYDKIVWYEAVRSKIITFHNFMIEHEEK